CDAPSDQPPPEQLAGPFQVSADGALADIELSRGLVLRSSFEVAEDQGRAEGLGQSPQFLVQDAAKLAPSRVIGDGRPTGFGHSQFAPPTPFRLRPEFQSRAPGDTVQPTRQR